MSCEAPQGAKPGTPAQLGYSPVLGFNQLLQSQPCPMGNSLCDSITSASASARIDTRISCRGQRGKEEGKTTGLHAAQPPQTSNLPWIPKAAGGLGHGGGADLGTVSTWGTTPDCRGTFLTSQIVPTRSELPGSEAPGVPPVVAIPEAVDGIRRMAAAVRVEENGLAVEVDPDDVVADAAEAPDLTPG